MSYAGHVFEADAWRCALCHCLIGTLNAEWPCPGAQHDDTAPGDAETAQRVIDWSRINEEAAKR